MKKLLVLLTVAVALLGFSSGAFAQALDVCYTCNKCPLGSVACPQTLQGGTPTCSYFDFEDYTTYVQGTRSALDNCRAVFSICNCLNAGTTFVEGRRVGVALTIKVNNQFGQLGAYWSQPASATIAFSAYQTPEQACAVTPPVYTLSFGPGQFFKSDTAGKSTGNPIAATSLVANPNCDVGATAQATRVVTNVDAGYIITAADELNKLARWVINIPPIRVDPKVVKANDKISVRIETLDLNTGGICADCVVSCECVIDVAIVCPTGLSASTCLFPYFTSVTAANDAAFQPWWNGIAITNTSAYDGTAKLTVTQQDGKTGTFTTPVIKAGSIFVRALENIPFVGTGLGGLPVWIKVDTTFPSMDGFGIMGDTSTGESMGYLCRK